jgi:hypothetical protein
MDKVTDKEITGFIKEKKTLPADFSINSIRFKDRENQKCCDLDVPGDLGNNYKIIIRQSKLNPLDFSVILGVMRGGGVFRIKRYNGDSHTHTNKLEGQEIDGYHIHKATERYQDAGFQEDAYAESANTYTDWQSALRKAIEENNFLIDVGGKQKRLFDNGQ